MLGLTATAMGNIQEGIDHYKAALALDPNYKDAWVNIFQSYKESGQARAGRGAPPGEKAGLTPRGVTSSLALAAWRLSSTQPSLRAQSSVCLCAGVSARAQTQLRAGASEAGVCCCRRARRRKLS